MTLHIWRSLVRPIIMLMAFASVGSCIASDGSPYAGEVGDGKFQSIVEQLVKNYNLPAITVVVTEGGEIVESVAVGKRSFANSTLVTEADYWQIGSLSKGITATLAARLVEQGLIAWDTTIEDIFPTYLDQIHPDYHAVTLADLLRHRGGLAREKEPTGLEKANVDRLGYCIRALKDAPSVSPGSFSYSNLGYTVAGLMLGQVTGLSWEDALQQYLFTPLEITNYGFGFPDPGDTHSQPIGHLRRFDNSGGRVNHYWIPLHPSESRIRDFLLINAPAGAIYLSKQDYLKYQNLHLYGAAGESDILSADSFQYLHYPPDDVVRGDNDYAMGWSVMVQDELEFYNLSSEERVLLHNGFVLSWMALSVIIPDRKLSIFIASNSGATSTDFALRDELQKVIFERLRITE